MATFKSKKTGKLAKKTNAVVSAKHSAKPKAAPVVEDEDDEVEVAELEQVEDDEAEPVQAAPQAPVAGAPKKKGTPSINRGKNTGMPIMQFQDKQLSENNKRKLTDEQLLAEMKAEFPNAKGKIFNADLTTRLQIMQAVRRLFNEGRHGKQDTARFPIPEGGSRQFNANGEIVGKAPKAAKLAKAS